MLFQKTIHQNIQYSSKNRFIKIFNIQYSSKNWFIKISNIIKNPKSLLATWLSFSESCIKSNDSLTLPKFRLTNYFSNVWKVMLICRTYLVWHAAITHTWEICEENTWTATSFDQACDYQSGRRQCSRALLIYTLYVLCKNICSPTYIDLTM